MHHAAIYGEQETLQYLLGKGIDASVLTENGSSALLLACIEGNVAIVQCLLQRGAKVNEVYFDAVTALSVAASNKNYSVMLELLTRGANPDLIGEQKHLPVVHSTINNDIKSVIILLQGNASLGLADNSTEANVDVIEHTHPLHVAIVKNHSDLILLLMTVEHNVNFIRGQLKNGYAYCFVQSDVVLRALCDATRAPPRLQLLCRAVIRRCLGIPLLAKVESLHNVPTSVKNYLTMQELWGWIGRDHSV